MKFRNQKFNKALNSGVKFLPEFSFNDNLAAFDPMPLSIQADDKLQVVLASKTAAEMDKWIAAITRHIYIFRCRDAPC